jgi:hypothetical protein
MTSKSQTSLLTQYPLLSTQIGRFVRVVWAWFAVEPPIMQHSSSTPQLPPVLRRPESSAGGRPSLARVTSLSHANQYPHEPQAAAEPEATPPPASDSEPAAAATASHSGQARRKAPLDTNYHQSVVNTKQQQLLTRKADLMRKVQAIVDRTRSVVDLNKPEVRTWEMDFVREPESSN